MLSVTVGVGMQLVSYNMGILQGIVLVILYIAIVQAKDYSDYRLITATPADQDQVTALVAFLQDSQSKGVVDVWSASRLVSATSKLLVPTRAYDDTIAVLAKHSIKYEVLEDVQSAVQEEAMRMAAKSRMRSGKYDLHTYHNHSFMNEFVYSMAGKCDICRTWDIGMSYEGRYMVVIQIGRWELGKPAIWVDAGIHAREWIAPATALNLIDKLVNGHLDGDKEVRTILDNFIVYVLPSANPDGYTYSRNQERFWRKTRKPTANPNCVGTDPNRNWDYHWAESGVSFDRCSDIFPGGAAFSEVETRNIRKFLWQRRKQLVVYLSLHAYGQYWLYPWGYDDSLPDDWEELQRVGELAISAILGATGAEYTLGSSTHVLYAAAGASDDWAKGVAGIKYSYTVELPDTGYYGFLLPESKIADSFEQFWPGFANMAYGVHEYLQGTIDSRRSNM